MDYFSGTGFGHLGHRTPHGALKAHVSHSLLRLIMPLCRIFWFPKGPFVLWQTGVAGAIGCVLGSAVAYIS